MIIYSHKYNINTLSPVQYSKGERKIPDDYEKEANCGSKNLHVIVESC